MLPTVYEKPLSLGCHMKAIQKLQVNCSCRHPHSGSDTVDCMQLVQGFIQDLFLGGGNVDAYKKHVHASVHPLGFCRFLSNCGHI